MTDLVVSVPADLVHPSLLRETVLALSGPLAAHGMTVPAERLQLWGLAVYEAATNVARYADATTLALEIGVREPGLFFTLRDQGRAHDSWDVVSSPEEFAEGGYGMWIIRELMHTVQYRRTAEGVNELELGACWPPCPACASPPGLASSP
jgi:anti-sigma regulatory factor (Ser/Thr protein kinase)